jgi:dTDP-glucose pyrophosphorylase/CBS domain-containing protein
VTDTPSPPLHVSPDASDVTLVENASLHDCVLRLRDSHSGMLLFIDATGRFCGILTLGDIIRLVAARRPLDQPVADAINRNPVTLGAEAEVSAILDYLLDRGLTAAPLVKGDGTLAGIATVAEYSRRQRIRARVLIMAGGEGLRLRPLTENLPKPMLPVGGRPILERIISTLKDQGLRDIFISVRYLKDKIIDHFGDGSGFGVRISYVEEDVPLGTAGALSRLPATTRPTLLMNADLLTDLDFRKMIEFHHNNQADVTMAVKAHSFQVPYGVVRMEMNRIVGLEEKPNMVSHVNGGIYVLSPRAAALVPEGSHCDATTLVNQGLASGQAVLGYPIQSEWTDIGAMRDYYSVCDRFDGGGDS